MLFILVAYVGAVLILTSFEFYFVEHDRNYYRCLGFESIYNDETRPNGLPIYHPFRMAYFLCFLSHSCLAPYFYIQIFNHRKNYINTTSPALGLGQNAINRRFRRNIVSGRIDFFIWLVEASIVLAIPGGEMLILVYLLLNTFGTLIIYYKNINFILV